MSLEELKKVVFASKGDGALSPDGFPNFFQKFWDIVCFDLLKLVDFFLAGR